jgi:hypothetical protein
LFGVNVVLHVYPVLLQRLTRSRIEALSRRPAAHV